MNDEDEYNSCNFLKLNCLLKIFFFYCIAKFVRNVLMLTIP